MIDTIAAGNAGQLCDLVEVTERLPDQVYRRRPGKLPQTPGMHVRHIIEHYEQFFAGLAQGEVNYDARRRNRLYETDRFVACTKLRDLIALLEQLSGNKSASGIKPGILTMVICTDGRQEKHVVLETTPERELLFLLQHTVHHCAQIKLLLEQAGISTAASFGLAPSTLKFIRHHNTQEPAITGAE